MPAPKRALHHSCIRLIRLPESTMQTTPKKGMKSRRPVRFVWLMADGPLARPRVFLSTIKLRAINPRRQRVSELDDSEENETIMTLRGPRQDRSAGTETIQRKREFDHSSGPARCAPALKLFSRPAAEIGAGRWRQSRLSSTTTTASSKEQPSGPQRANPFFILFTNDEFVMASHPVRQQECRAI